jgi:hypothetical protein
VGTDIAHLLSVASSQATRTGSENHPDELQVSDEVFAQIKANIVYLSLVLGAQRQRTANLVSHKRRGPPGPDACVTNQGDTTSRKKRRVKESEETGVRLAAERGESQELPGRWTPQG